MTMIDGTRLSIAGAILAGGKARRMGGFPKGRLQAGSRLSIVEHLAQEIVCSGIEEVVIVANDEGAYRTREYRILPDRRVGLGPLAGIEAALAHFARRYEAVLCLPCDTPALSSQEILGLAKAFAAVSAPLVFAETDNEQRHPLCAIVNTCLLADISAALDMNMLCVGDLWQRLGGLRVRFRNPDAFSNLNTYADVSQWQRGHLTWTSSQP
jgi:molybdopterin-guanine dinucleotide biosynthesis protein A